MAVNRNCHYCGTRFETSNTRRLFCKDACKTRYNREHRLTCFYCGELATSKDHIYPQLFGDGNGDTVNACTECNSTMQAVHEHSIENRVAFLYKRYVKKYQLDKQIPEWDDEELNELGYTLRSAIQSKIMQRQRALERAIHINARWNEIRRLTNGSKR